MLASCTLSVDFNAVSWEGVKFRGRARRPVSRGVQQVQLHPQYESRVHFSRPVSRRVQQGATGASAKLRLN
jgi:hypothetical protein